MVRSGEARRGDTTIRVPVALCDSSGSAITPLILDGTDLGDTLLGCRVVGIVARTDLWNITMLSQNIYDALAIFGTFELTGDWIHQFCFFFP